MVNVEQAKDFLRQHHRGVLTTYRRDGRLQMSPILIGINNDGLGVLIHVQIERAGPQKSG